MVSTSALSMLRGVLDRPNAINPGVIIVYQTHYTISDSVSAKGKNLFMNGRSCKCDIVGNTKLVILTK